MYIQAPLNYYCVEVKVGYVLQGTENNVIVRKARCVHGTVYDTYSKPGRHYLSPNWE